MALLSQEQGRINVRGGVAEIGVHHGKFFIVLYLVSSANEPAVAIDLFSQQHLNTEASGEGDLEQFKRNLSKYADTSHLVVHEGDSTQLCSADLLRLGGGTLRLISVDGGHTPEITAHDLGTAEGALCEGGILILDDCFNGMWPGVSEGLHRYFAERRNVIPLVPFAIGANKVFFCHEEFADRYSEVLHGMTAKFAEHDFLRHKVVCLDFSPLTLAERISGMAAWRKFRHLPAGKWMRRLYHALHPG